MAVVRLVTTKYSRSCGSTDAVHLGDWCLEGHPSIGDNLVFLSKRMVSVQEKIQSATECSRIAESIFPEVVENLNNYHGISKSYSYWRIILGLWLQNFVDVVFQRDTLIRRALNEFPVSGADGIEINYPVLVADCTQDYLSQLVSQEWNSALFSEILSFRGVKVSSLEIPLTHSVATGRKRNQFPERSFFDKLYGTASQKSILAFADPYLGRAEQIELALRTKSLPLRVNRTPLRSNDYDVQWRSKFVIQQPSHFSIETLIKNLLPFHLPRSVVEHYGRMTDSRTWFGYPNKPKSIFTANAHLSSDHFASWAAQKVEDGATLLISQHGGLYGESELRTRHEVHEISVANRYLTWGWDDKTHGNMLKIPCLIGIGLKSNNKKLLKRQELVVVADTTLRMSRHSWDNSYDRQQYVARLQKILRTLTTELKNQVILRLHHSHSELDVDHTTWFEDIENLKIDQGRIPMHKVLKSARLAITTTLGTTFGENIFRKIPTVVCIDPVVYPPRLEYAEIFSELEKVGVFYTDPIKMCDFVISSWAELESWWNSKAVNKAVVAYQQVFFNVQENPIKEVARVIALGGN